MLQIMVQVMPHSGRRLGRITRDIYCGHIRSGRTPRLFVTKSSRPSKQQRHLNFPTTSQAVASATREADGFTSTSHLHLLAHKAPFCWLCLIKPMIKPYGRVSSPPIHNLMMRKEEEENISHVYCYQTGHAACSTECGGGSAVQWGAAACA